MSSRRRRPPRRSWSPRCIADSLLGDGLHQRAGHLVLTLELQPVSGALENLQSKIAIHVLRGALRLQATESWVLIAPQQDSWCGHVQIGSKTRPPVVSRKIGAVVVESRGETARPCQRADE